MKKSRRIYFGILALAGVVCFSTHAQRNSLQSTSELGLPYSTYYKPDEYKAFNQNWGAVQDSLGVLYFANGSGVLTYDGVHWNLVELPNKSHTKSIAIDLTNKVYVGASGEFGFLKSGPQGKLEYESLVTHLDERDKNFGTVWNIYATSEGIYFQTHKRMFLWDGKDFTIWRFNEEELRESYYASNKVYAHIENKGIIQFANGQLKSIIDEDQLGAAPYSALLPYDTDSFILASYTKGLFLIRDNKITKFSTEIDEYFLRNRLYSGLKLSDNTYAFGTLTDGLVILNSDGRQLLKYDNETAGTPIVVLNIFEDTSGILWVLLNDGILKMEYPSPFTFFDKKNGINSRIQKIYRYQKNLLVGSANGLYVLDRNADDTGSSFRIFGNFNAKIWDLLEFDDLLLVADEDAVYEIRDGESSKKIDNFNAAAFLRSEIDPNRVFIALSDGLRSIYYQNGQWADEGKITGVEGSTYTIVETNSGDLWLETSEDWIWNVSFSSVADAKNLRLPNARKYGVDEGLPGTWGDLFLLEDEVYFASGNGQTYHFNKASKKFDLAKDLSDKLGMSDEIILINHVDHDGNIWFTSTSDEVPTRWVGYSDDGEYKICDLKQTRISDDVGGSETLFYEKKDSVLWLTGINSVIRHDLKAESKEHEDYRALVHTIRYKKDSMLLQGFYHKSAPTLPFKNNSFRFQYASPSFHGENANQYQYYLDGFDQEWSYWTPLTQIDYTNIPEGDYAFKVQAKNIYGHISQEGRYTFTILPPWYRSWWAYLLYALGAAVLIWVFSYWRSAQLRMKNLALEAVVAERTEEIREKNKKLSYQTEKLKELDTMKTRLFANISHEFRTPLTLIKGPIEKLEEARQNKISTTNVKMIRRNANRLLNLVNQLLDLSKLDSGKLQLEASEGDVFKCIRAAASSFGSHAAQRNMDYQIRVPARSLWASFDRDKLEKICYNLLGNAFKFTPDTGKIIIRSEYRNNQLYLEVKDTGPGMAMDKLPHIFDRFFQVDDSYTREKTGSGIGLSLTRELAELMQGEIYVESELGKGSIFKVVVPLEEIKSHKTEELHAIPTMTFEEETESLPTDSTSKSAINVLVIEDNNDMRHFIKEQLVEDYNVLEAYNGKEGLKDANKLVPDLIITDLMMPQMDGITLCKKLKTNLTTSHIPVIMLTAKAGIENKLEGLETGADDYLTKPFNARELQVRVKNLIAQRRQLRELYAKNISLDPKEITVTSLDEEFLEEVLTVMEEKYTESTFGVTQLQKAMTMSKTQLHRKIKALTNHPPSELLRNFRLKRAAQILLQRGENISQVAYDVGFNSLSYFTKCFKDLYGISPTTYVEENNTSTK